MKKGEFGKILRKWGTRKKYVFVFLFCLVVLAGIYHSCKFLPEGISYEGSDFMLSEEEVDFLYDLTYEAGGERVYDHEIFDSIFEVIDGAERYILIDMFLWSKSEEASIRDIGQEMTDHLVARKMEVPELEIVVVTDSFNNGYGSFKVGYFEEMRAVGIDVVYTDLDGLRDSNLLYSPIWRVFFQIFGEPPVGWISIPGYEEDGSIWAFLKLMNFKANHRKTMIADCGDEMCSFVISANPAASGAEHSNVGMMMKGGIYEDIYDSEKAVLEMSGYDLGNWNFDFVEERVEKRATEVRFLTEGKIEKAIIEEIDESVAGEEIKVAIFYFSDRDVADALLRASERGVDIEIVVDPSKTGFGKDKFGIPSRMVADELVEKSGGKIKVRYYDTDEEQFHTKMIVFVREGRVIVILGSCNYTRRNMDDLNLEANVRVVASADSDVAVEVLAYFRKIWYNEGGHYSVEFDSFESPSILRKVQYRFQEFSGAGTF